MGRSPLRSVSAFPDVRAGIGHSLDWAGMDQRGPHEWAIATYLDDIGVEPGFIPSEDRERIRLGMALDRELRKQDGEESFALVDEAGKGLGVVMISAETGLTLVSLDADHKQLTTEVIGHLERAILIKSRPIDEGDPEPQYRLVVRHELLPNGSVIHEVSSEKDLDAAAERFRPALK